MQFLTIFQTWGSGVPVFGNLGRCSTSFGRIPLGSLGLVGTWATGMAGLGGVHFVLFDAQTFVMRGTILVLSPGMNQFFASARP